MILADQQPEQRHTSLAPDQLRGDVGKTVEERLNVQPPALHKTLLEVLSQRDASVQATPQAQLEKLLESYLGS